jgi:YebC/PmpR family DNA-binding regulatory protein
MAGHSKWANIKHKKGKADAKRGKVFSRIVKEIITAVKLSGPDIKSNPRLRMVLAKAKAANMSSDTIDKNIKKASSPDQSAFEEGLYELYGHGGVGLIVDILTDNKNRTASDLRIATNKCGGTIASPGSVAFNFERKGVIEVEANQAIEEELFSTAIEGGADDFEKSESGFVILTDPKRLHEVKEAVEASGTPITEADIAVLPKTTVTCSEEDRAANQKLIEWLEDLDDVSEVFHNMADN